MIRKIRIRLVEHAFLNFTVQKMPLYQNRQFKIAMPNEYACLLNRDVYKDLTIYKVQALNQSKGGVYIKDDLTEKIELEVMNDTGIKGAITISNLNLKTLTTIGFEKVYIEKSSIQMIEHNDKKKVKVDCFSQIGKIK